MIEFRYNDNFVDVNDSKIFTQIMVDSDGKTIEELLELFKEFLRICGYSEKAIELIGFNKTDIGVIE